ncbi:MAG: nucleotidyl transferase AbiEii/AbiGii toxin family protein [Firmicutes bacterium]|nr:nucleotidyl transferase AbiEii/AbiGii toxin family protein [Bacillota bacterium]
MNNAMQLKAIMKNMSKDKHISAQLILQNYMLERLLERISMSPYQSHFILKGGFLIASIVGLDTRATMDMDVTLRGFPANVESITKMFEEICQIPLSDAITFTLRHVESIRESADYSGLRIALEANYPPMKVPLKIDLTTGDKITPREIVYEYKLLLEPRCIKILAYNLETILAEKLETIITRGDQNTRPRDYYDVFIIRQLQWQNVNADGIYDALVATAQNRNTLALMEQYPENLQTIKNSPAMHRHWINYQNQFDYAKDIEFNDICTVILDILNNMDWPQRKK